MFTSGTSLDGFTVPPRVFGEGEPIQVGVTYRLDEGNTRLLVAVEGACEWDLGYDDGGVLQFLGEKGVISNPDEWTLGSISGSEGMPMWEDGDPFVTLEFRRHIDP